MPVDMRDIEEWLSDVYQVAHAMGHALKAGRWYRNLAACNVNQRRCKFLSLCLSGDVDAAAGHGRADRAVLRR